MISNIQLNSNSSQYYSQKNKYLITFNSNPRKFDISSDGVIRGYTNNCTFYISGSSDLKSKINYKNKDYNSNKNRKTYENSNKSNTISTIESKRNEKNINIDNKRYINNNNNISRKDNNNNIKIYTNTTVNNYGQNNSLKYVSIMV